MSAARGAFDEGGHFWASIDDMPPDAVPCDKDGNPLDIIREPATWRRPLGVIDADVKRGTRATRAATGVATRTPHLRPVRDALVSVMTVCVSAVFMFTLEASAIMGRALARVHRLRRTRHDDLDPDVLAQIRVRRRPSRIINW